MKLTDCARVVPAIVCQIYYSDKAMKSTDPTFDMWQPAVAILVVQALSILTLCIPFIRPFLESLESGLLRADGVMETMKGGGTTRAGYGRESSNRNASNGSASRHDTRHELADFSEPKVSLTTASVNAGTSWDGQSHHSQAGLIRQTKTWDVMVE